MKKALLILVSLFILPETQAKSFWGKAPSALEEAEVEASEPAKEEATGAFTHDDEPTATVSPKLKLKKKILDKKKRELAAIENEIEAAQGGEDVSPRSRLTKKLARKSKARLDMAPTRVSFLGGYSAYQANPMLSLGLNADIRFSYFGFELEGFYGFGTNVKNMGGSLAVKGHYPFYLSGVKIIPKLGAGFSLQQLSQSEVILGTTVTGKSSLSGVFGTGGLEVEIMSGWAVLADYSMSVMGNGSFESPAITADLKNSSFQRIRVGTQLALMDHFNVGVQYESRAQTWNYLTPITEKQDQVMGLIGYQW